MARRRSAPGIVRPLLVLLTAAGVLTLLLRPVTVAAKDGGGEVRASGICSNGAAAELRLKRRGQGIELRFKLDYGRSGTAWRVILVHERRIAWKATTTTTGANGTLEVRRTLNDLPGADTVTARAWGPRGLVCRATATLPES
jgi:hypothetical protein